ncbi:diguanylate cyclase [Sporosarcina gallistercoris]|uniref:Diguanylate cyclase n=1 Tax=Sporosarcina gallistercoris TaxID=2762245 RepID=A0ABR8PH33_9BACL|nr:diguanylate cyclase [Sporosarcina gallistercoris]MBD7907480.1 diguanylate cyclase [Sporosarcina gallistercoris]
MDYEKYQRLVTGKIEESFTQWDAKKFVKESELYTFLHTLKGTAGTIGLHDLAEFCSAHLEILSPHDESVIPISSLKNFKKNILLLADGNKKERRNYVLPDLYVDHFDQETFILIIDDDLEFVTFTKELLEQLGAQVLIAMDGKRGIQQFYDLQPNMVMIDLQLPDMSGLDVFDQIRDTASDRHVVSILMSSNHSNKVISQAYEAGLMDFIRKPLELDLFLPYLFNRDKWRKGISQSITTDGLTGVGNRKRLDEMLMFCERLTQRSGVPFSVVMMDLDHFKSVNDTYGHPAGDEVLKAFSRIALEEKRETDYIFRYGGEEFVILVSGGKGEAYTFAERLHESFNNIIFEEGDRSFSVTFSAGIAEYEGRLEMLLIEADQALYQAKRTGRNQSVIFDKNLIEVKRKLQVIIIDDDFLIRTMLEEELRGWSLVDIELSVKMFKDGISFLAADWFDPDTHFIILLDGIMPGMDGLEVLERLKRRPDTNNILVSMMTARTSEQDIKSALWLGADDYIMKPFQKNEILTRIQNLSSRMF